MVFVDEAAGSEAMMCAQDFIRHVNQGSCRPTCKVYVLRGGMVAWDALYSQHEQRERYLTAGPSLPQVLHECASSCGYPLSPSTASIASTESVCSDYSNSSQDFCWDVLASARLSTRSGDLGSYVQGAGEAPETNRDESARDKGSVALGFLASLAPGDSIWLFSWPLEKWVRAIITATNDDFFKVVYFSEKGRTFAEAVPRAASCVQWSVPDSEVRLNALPQD